MIGTLPKQLMVDNKIYDIRTDFRDCLKIIQAYGDLELTTQEKHMVMLKILYKDYEQLNNLREAVEQGMWFLNCGNKIRGIKEEKPVYDWEQDEQLIFAAINKTAGCETREREYIHWWTFISYFYEMGEGLFSSVIGIRSKLNKGKELDKGEKEFYRRNKEMIELKKKYSREQKEEMDRIDKMLG